MADTACDRVFHVQRTLASMDGPSHGPRAIAREAGLNKSTVHRILNSGLAYDVFVRDEAGKYRLGSGAVGLGMRAAAYRFSEAPQRQILARLLHEANGMLCAIESLTPLTAARRRTEQYVAEAGCWRSQGSSVTASWPRPALCARVPQAGSSCPVCRPQCRELWPWRDSRRR